MDILRLHLAEITVVEDPWPVHGFVLFHEGLGPVLVDTGCGGPEELMRDYRVVNREVAEVLAEHDLSPADIRVVINTHLHFDHCGQNAVFPHAAIHVQRAELERTRREDPWQRDWLEHAGAHYELLDGDVDVAPGLRVLATPGHTSGHQSVLVTHADSTRDLLVGDAAFTAAVYRNPLMADLPDGQAADRAEWTGSLRRVKGMAPERIHFCHDVEVVHGR